MYVYIIIPIPITITIPILFVDITIWSGSEGGFGPTGGAGKKTGPGRAEQAASMRWIDELVQATYLEAVVFSIYLDGFPHWISVLENNRPINPMFDCGYMDMEPSEFCFRQV